MSQEEINQKLNDPTQPFKSMVFFDTPTINYYGRSGSNNVVQWQPVIPFTMYGKMNILRLTLPYNTGGVNGRGLNAIQVFNLTMFKAGKGNFAIGPILNFNTNWENLPEADRMQAGPAWGYVVPLGKWTLGILQQNLFSKNVQISSFQPLLAYALPDGWSVGMGSGQWSFTWSEGGGLNQIPINPLVSKLVKFPGNQLVRFSVNPEYNAKAGYGAPHWTIRFNVNILVR